MSRAVGRAGLSGWRRRTLRPFAQVSAKTLLLAAAVVIIGLVAAFAVIEANDASPVSVRTAATADAGPTPRSGLPTVAASALPAEARQVLGLIDAGGPFPFVQDGTVFTNAERILPQRAAGYYREYTVRTPGSSDRGARRLVVGRGGDVYYTDDHYASFRQVLR